MVHDMGEKLNIIMCSMNPDKMTTNKLIILQAINLIMNPDQTIEMTEEGGRE